MSLQDHRDEVVITEHEARKLLDILCTKFGYCLSPLWTARLQKNPPRTPEKFIDTVIRAEGLNPAELPKSAYRNLLEKTREAFSRSKNVTDS
jgi:hypothetical protein